MKKRIIAIIGEAGTGKDSLVDRLIKDKELFTKIIPCTTRPPRDGESNGVQYYFLPEKEFQIYASSFQILDQTCFKGWLYGAREFDLSYEKINIGVFNPAGVRQIIKRNDLDVKVFRLKVEPAKRMQRQLCREAKPDVSEIARRFLADEQDFKNLDFKMTELSNNFVSDLKQNIKIIQKTAYNWDNIN